LRSLAFLAKEISDAHKQVLFHGRSMVSEAIRAGEALKLAKAELKAKRKAGQEALTFVEWVNERCSCGYAQGARYMQVAEKVRGAAKFPEDITIHELLYGEPQKDQRERKRTEAAATFSREDAEYALKIHALVERGGTEAEREVAAPSPRLPCQPSTPERGPSTPPAVTWRTSSRRITSTSFATSTC